MSFLLSNWTCAENDRWHPDRLETHLRSLFTQAPFRERWNPASLRLDRLRNARGRNLSRCSGWTWRSHDEKGSQICIPSCPSQFFRPLAVNLQVARKILCRHVSPLRVTHCPKNIQPLLQSPPLGLRDSTWMESHALPGRFLVCLPSWNGHLSAFERLRSNHYDNGLIQSSGE